MQEELVDNDYSIADVADLANSAAALMTVVVAVVVVVVVVVVLFVDNDEDDTLCEFDRHVFTRYALQFLYQLFQWSWVDASRLRDCEFATGQYSFISHLVVRRLYCRSSFITNQAISV